MTSTPSPGLPDGAAVPAGWFARLRRLLVGPARNPFDPRVFSHVSLAAFLAWVGLGADGLSSICYGPEEAFLALGPYRGLAAVLALLTALTVVVISLSYAQLIAAFPSGGGAYLVASKLLGPWPGLVAGAALVVDYVLTAAISIASGADALFSFLPPEWWKWRLAAAFAALVLLVVMNLRGVRESVAVMAPVFLVFVIAHVAMILTAVLGHGGEAQAVAGEAMREAHEGSAALGTVGLLAVLLRAYSLGGGTYTGIEAVSNSLPLLREPRVKTARRAMLYMAGSLAFCAGGILIGYLFVGVEPVAGRTLNAVLFERTLGTWPAGAWLVKIALLSEAALLAIAAQTGFLGGPQVLSAMAADQWVPRRFQHLSVRLVRSNGVLILGIAAAAVLLATSGRVALLVVLYSINVFLTFTLSQLGMVRHWWRERRSEPRWLARAAVNSVGLVATSFILVVTVWAKFSEGGWVTLVTTAAIVAVCAAIRRHYQRVQGLFRRLDAALDNLPAVEPPARGAPDPGQPTAVVLVGGYRGLGIHTLLSVFRYFGDHYKGVVFISVGIVDSSRFKGPQELEALRESVGRTLEEYVQLARRLGVPADSAARFGTDPVAEIEQLAHEVRARYPRAVFFAGKLVFQKESFWTRMLHNQTALSVQSSLHPKGYPLVVLPILAE